jgi:gamma-glutamylcyclotransferase (GGCT)/AIG2-like uncharacterized protein YtfP
MKHVFTYGSLMFPEVWQRVVRGHYRAEPATLAGYSRHALAQRDYPGMVVAAELAARVEGVLWRDVDDADLARLDQFEGEQYERIEVTVQLATGLALQAGTYLYIAGDLQSEQQWDPQAFVTQRFLQAYAPASDLD